MEVAEQCAASAIMYADQLVEAARCEPDKLLQFATNTVHDCKWKSLRQKLLEVFMEAACKRPVCQNVHKTSNLLAQLVDRENLNTLVVNLYPGNEGYSLLLHGRNGSDSETIRLPYEEMELLEYIDAAKLPPLLVDLFDKAQANLFHGGCVIAEVRDYRHSTSNLFDRQYVLLEPTMHTLLCDMNAMTCEAQQWTTEDKLSLESQLLLETSEPLCLDPSPAVFHVTNKLAYHRHKFNTQSLQRCARHCSQAAINRRRKLSLCAAPKHLRLYDFVKHRKTKNKSAVNLRLASVSCVDTWKRSKVELSVPENIDVEKFAKALDRPQLTVDNSPVVVEEYTFETERRDGRVNMSRLVIMQRLSDESYLGTLYVDRDFRDTDSKGNACRFVLGTKAHVEKYVRQFREIFTEEGRRQVKITHQVAGRPPTVTYTQLTNVGSSQAGSQGSQQAGSLGSVVGETVMSQCTSQPQSSSIGASFQPISLSQPHLSVELSATNAGSTAGFTNLAQTQLRLSIQQHEQLSRQKSVGQSSPAVPGPAGLNLPKYNTMPSQQHRSSQQTPTVLKASAAMLHPGIPSQLAPGIKSPPAALMQQSSGLKSPTAIMLSVMPSQHAPGLNSSPVVMHSGTASLHEASANLTELLLDTSSCSNSAVAWTNQPSTVHVMSSLSSVAPPNINIATVGSFPPNVNIQNISRLQTLHQAPPGTSLQPEQQRTFVTMVTTTATFGPTPTRHTVMSSSGTILSPTSGMFSPPVSHNQFTVPSATIRGLVRSSASSVTRPPTVLMSRTGPLFSNNLLAATATTNSAPAAVAAIGPPPSVLTSPTMVSQFRIQHQQVLPSAGIRHQHMSPRLAMGAGFQLPLQNVRQPLSNTVRRPPTGRQS